MVDGRPRVERVVTKRDPGFGHTKDWLSYTDSALSIYEDPSEEIPPTKSHFAANFQNNDILIQTESDCDCDPNCHLAGVAQSNDFIVQASSDFSSSTSTDGAEDPFVEMMIPGKSEGSGSPTSSSSKSTGADDPGGSIGSRSLDKTVSFSSGTTTDMGEAENMRNTCSNNQPNLTKEALRRYVEAKVSEDPSPLCSIKSSSPHYIP